METKWIDYRQGLSRFSGAETLYRKYLIKFPEDPTFAQLQSAMAAGDYGEAFRCAHTLKGITGNLSLTSLSDAVGDLVEQLRDQRNIPGAMAAWGRLQEIYQETLCAIRVQP